jgi:hypothetical protein
MAQTQEPCQEGYAELAKLLCCYTAGSASGAKGMVLIKTTITVSETQTYSGITKVTETGLAIADGTITNVTTTYAYDSAKVNYKWTAGASVSLLGFAVTNDENDALYMICGFDTAIGVASGDTIDCTGTMQVKKGT